MSLCLRVICLLPVLLCWSAASSPAQQEWAKGVAPETVVPDYMAGDLEFLSTMAQQVAIGQTPTLPTIPGFTVLGELGHGGMGKTALACKVLAIS